MNTIKFIDCIESRFSSWSSNTTIMNENWIGIFHYSPDLPNFIKDDLDYIVNNMNVLRSLPFCKGIIVLSNNSYNHLIKNPHYKNINIISLKHPIENIENKFSIERFISNTKKMVVQLGSQDRITSTIYKLNTKYKKLWLPGRDTAINYLKRECIALNIHINQNDVNNDVDNDTKK